MRIAAVLSLAIAAGPAGGARAASHQYTQAQRYAGCLFGETIPLMRHGWERERALSTASDRCVALSEGLSATDVLAVDADVHRAIEETERQGL